MTRDEIITMAREAGFTASEIAWHDEMFERFAALIASRAAAAAKLEMLMAGHDEWLEEARKAEREACIDLVAMFGGPVDLEAAIRVRGETTSRGQA